MFINEPAVLEKEAMSVARGATTVTNEFERMMEIEAKELIRTNFESASGLRKMHEIHKRNQEDKYQDKTLLECTDLESKIKLKNMPNVWAVTRTSVMSYWVFESIIMVWLSNLQGLIYTFMILSMISNSGLISLIYPPAVLGYALLEENRPRKEFW